MQCELHAWQWMFLVVRKATARLQTFKVHTLLFLEGTEQTAYIKFRAAELWTLNQTSDTSSTQQDMQAVEQKQTWCRVY